MTVEHLDATFDALDTLSIETLALFMLTDRRPLRGVAGLVDWRLCGELSRALQSGGITGKLGERLLMPTHSRVGARRLLVFGAGSSTTPLPALELGKALAAARLAGANELALELPENASPDAVASAVNSFDGKRLVLIGASAEQKERLSQRASERASKRA
ncbi:MAG: hypothetical protein JST54_16840 [Deltaproteobacteria bacterium]|nr:hypothetical protein [Deltaproteobacteria bacterium]